MSLSHTKERLIKVSNFIVSTSIIFMGSQKIRLAPSQIRKFIYTIKLKENLNGKIRKYTKNKLSLTTDEAVLKFISLILKEATEKWTMPIHNWGLILNHFLTIFEKWFSFKKSQILIFYTYVLYGIVVKK